MLVSAPCLCLRRAPTWKHLDRGMLRVNVVVPDPRMRGGTRNDTGYRPTVGSLSMTQKGDGLTERQHSGRPSLNCATLLSGTRESNAVDQLVPIGRAGILTCWALAPCHGSHDGAIGASWAREVMLAPFTVDPLQAPIDCLIRKGSDYSVSMDARDAHRHFRCGRAHPLASQ